MDKKNIGSDFEAYLDENELLEGNRSHPSDFFAYKAKTRSLRYGQ